MAGPIRPRATYVTIRPGYNGYMVEWGGHQHPFLFLSLQDALAHIAEHGQYEKWIYGDESKHILELLRPAEVSK